MPLGAQYGSRRRPISKCNFKSFELSQMKSGCELKELVT